MIEINNLHVGYGKKEVLSGLSVSFDTGKLTAVVGVNGSGKSTLLKSVLRIVCPSEGEITVNGEKTDGMKPIALARKIAYLPQGNSVPDMTVFQMVLHGRFPHLSYPRKYSARDRDIAVRAMKKMGVDAFAQSRMSELSGGMRQNACIAMSLAQDTEYVLLDEPTTYLDISHSAALLKSLRVLASEGRGIVAVMHDLPLALTFCDEIAVIGSGQVLLKGTPREIYESDVIGRIFGVEIACDTDGNYSYRLQSGKGVVF